MTDKEKVLAKWPDARVYESPFDVMIGRRVYIYSMTGGGLVSSWMNRTEDAAWANAARRIEETKATVEPRHGN